MIKERGKESKTGSGSSEKDYEWQREAINEMSQIIK